MNGDSQPVGSSSEEVGVLLRDTSAVRGSQLATFRFPFNPLQLLS